MTAFPHWIESTEPLGRAKAMMAEHDVRHLPVKKDGALAGVITSRDIERAQLMSIGLRTEEPTVGDVSVPDAYVVTLDAPLEAVLREMASRGIGSALVERNDHLAGIFTTVDACRAFADLLADLSVGREDDSA